MSPTSRFMTEAIDSYIAAHSSAPSEIEQRLIDETQAMPGAIMQIGSAQAQFMSMLTALLSPRTVIEIGTFTGYSTLVMAKAMPAGSKLIACDTSEKWTSVGRPYWAEAGVDDRIDLRIGLAAKTLDSLPPDTVVDLAFLDADKTGYLGYFEKLVPMLSDRGVILVDNVLWSGRITDSTSEDKDTMALREFNSHVMVDPRVQVAMLPIGDGLSMITLAS